MAKASFALFCLLPRKNEVWVHVDDIDTVVEQLHEEVKSKGVAPVEEMVDELPETHAASVWWGTRDFAWCGRVTDLQGIRQRITKAVPKADRETGRIYTTEEFFAEKETVRMEVNAWIQTHR